VNYGGIGDQMSYTDVASVVAELANKVSYANTRWGATVFYVDSTVWSGGAPLLPAIWQQLQSMFPNCLFMPEESTDATYAYTAPYHDANQSNIWSSPSHRSLYPSAFAAINLGNTSMSQLSSGYAIVSGTTVTQASGANFATDGSWSGQTIYLNGKEYTVSSVSSPARLTLTSPAPPGVGVPWHVGALAGLVKAGMAYGDIYLYPGWFSEWQQPATAALFQEASLEENADNSTTAPPTININPVSSTVSGNVILSASTSANVVSVQYYLDSVALGGLQTTAPFSYTWNTTATANGPHTLTAVASTASNATATAAGILVTVSNASSGTGNSVTFLGQDTTTLGNWKDVYGNDGNYLGDMVDEAPSYATVSLIGVAQDMLNLWEYTDQRALQKPQYAYSPTERVESVFYAGRSFSVQVNSTNNQIIHRIALYFCDYLNQGESVTLEVLDGATKNVLNTQVLTSYTAGIYLVYNYTGNVTFVIKNNIQSPYAPWATVAAFFWG
jgi:hypothetical protein